MDPVQPRGPRDQLVTEHLVGRADLSCKAPQNARTTQLVCDIALTAAVELIIERLTTRTTNLYGKDPEERAQVLDDQRKFEPLLRRGATMVVDTSAPIEQVMATILDRIRR